MAGAAVLGLSRELRTQPVRNRPRTSRREQVEHKPVATSLASARPPQQAHSPRATSCRKAHHRQPQQNHPDNQSRTRPPPLRARLPQITSAPNFSEITSIYRCPPRALGGCSACISASKLDPLIEELLVAHISANAPQDDELAAAPDPGDPDAAELADVQARLSKLRTGYAQGTVTDDSMFNIVPQLETRERKLRSELAKKAKIRRGRIARAQSADDVRREWDAGDTGIRRAILSRYLKAIVIRKSTLANTRLVDYSAIEPIWRTESDPMPDDFLTL